ncbi:bifunctional diguanylate cyclase/phosphodiesterase [Cohaesibacter celericrescens]|uniref:bifunctional diguanylate cyclase/phosphodiesterase n=1 Tax=Cohaesibacter celericrescens TaxID=2067669 RepID=UPI003568B965
MSQSVSRQNAFWQKAKRRIWNVANLPAIMAMLVVAASTFVAEDLNQNVYIQRARADLQNEANLIAVKLQGLIEANVKLVRGLSITIATEPNIDQIRFVELAKSLFDGSSELKSIAGAPELVVSMIYPVKGNEKAIGLDYRRNHEQRAMALRARDFGETNLAGPINLVQGGQGLIARYPIYYNHAVHGLQFWGLLSSVIDINKIYQASGLLDQAEADFVLVGKDGKGAGGQQFFGPKHVNDNNPVSATVDFGLGQWELRAVPKSGWHVTPPNVWAIRGAALAALLLVVLPIAFVGWLFRERMAHLNANLNGQIKIARMKKRLELALETSQIGVWEFEPKTGKTSWDGRMNELYGFPQDHAITGEQWIACLHPDDRERVNSEVQGVTQESGMYKSEFRVILPDGKERTIRTVGSMMSDDLDEQRLVGVNWDISEDVAREKDLCDARAESDRRYQELEIAKARIENNSLHDFLTGLPNRRYLDDKLNGNHGNTCLMEDTTYLMKIDLDGFKEVNDNFGHAAGDAMLVNVAKILNQLIINDEFAARVGGDEFIVLCCSGMNDQRPTELARQLIEKIQVPIVYKGRTCRLGASIGVACGLEAEKDSDKLLSNADMALYQSKQDGKGCVTFFSQSMSQSARHQRQLADDLLRGIENREFIAFYQGQYCAHTHALVGTEALARWEHPERGVLAPSEFVELAESLGVMGAIDAMILDHAAETQKYWTKLDFSVPRVSVNVSAKRLGDKELIANLEKMDCDLRTLTFELVESTFLDRSDAQVAANIRQIREMGIDIEIDDFGTAYASIVSLTHLLPNRLKIDRQLIQPVIDSADQRELVHSIIHIGRTLGIGTVAEGVESMEHAEILRIMGVDILQGFAFSRPMNRVDFVKDHSVDSEQRIVANVS